MNPIPPQDFTPREQSGWFKFWASHNLSVCGQDETWGWHRGWARAYAEGFHSAAIGIDEDCPYPQFSGPWEAWGDGCNEGYEIFHGHKRVS